MKKKLLYLILLVCPIGLVSANNTSNTWPSQFFHFKKVKTVKKTVAPKQETNFEFLPASWL